MGARSSNSGNPARAVRTTAISEAIFDRLMLPAEAPTRERLELAACMIHTQRDLREWVVFLAQATGEDPRFCGVLLAAPGSDLDLLQELVKLWEKVYVVELPVMPPADCLMPFSPR